ncbi:MAG TPA: glycosyltransferase family 39 protein [Steroidobacteraceae bacterium]
MLRKSWMFGFAAFACTVLWFTLLAGRPLFDPDEGRYAEIPREMLSGGDWVIPHLNALVYLEKPPLQYWLTAGALRAFGESEFAARLATGIAGYVALAVVFLLGRELWGAEAGARALLYTLASSLFVLLGHQLTLDMLLCCCLTVALGCFLMAQARGDAVRWRLWMLGCWAGMALGVLAKGLVGALIPAATLCIYSLWQRDWRVLGRLNLRWGLPLFAVLAAPWFIAAAVRNAQFLRFFFIREHLQRFLTPIEHRTEPWWFFMPVLIVAIMPWLPQAMRALAAALGKGAPRADFDAPRLLGIWCVFVLVFFSLSDSKLIPYILPAVPALALLCASQPRADSRACLLAGALLTLGCCAGILAYASGRWSTAEARALVLLIRPMLFWTSACLALGALAAALCVLSGRRLAAVTGLCGFWFLASGTILLAAIPAAALFSAKDVAMILQSRAGPADPIFAVQSYQQSLAFYLRRPVILVGYRDEFDLGLTQNPERGIATLPQFAATWLGLDGGGFAVMPPRTLERLSALGVPLHEIARFPDEVIISRR